MTLVNCALAQYNDVVLTNQLSNQVTQVSVRAGFDQAMVPDLENYKLNYKDVLRFRIEEDPVKSTEPLEVVVTALGYASFPVCRNSDTVLTLNVRGKTLAQVKAELKEKLDAEYYNDCHIYLQLLTSNLAFGQAYFFGRVRGVVKLTPGEPKTVTEAIIELGFDDFADLKRVRINRMDPQTQKIKVINVNVKKVLDGDRTLDQVLQDGDRVEVPEVTFRLW